MKLSKGIIVGRLTLIEKSGVRRFPSGKTHGVWKCRCSCGVITLVDSANLHSSHTKSCGCLNFEKLKTSKLKHGHYSGRTPSTLMATWKNMRARCSDPKHISWEYYGARGIQVKWKDFDEFLKDMADSWRPGLSIDRIDPNGHYEKSNCRWADPHEQRINQRKRRWWRRPKEANS